MADEPLDSSWGDGIVTLVIRIRTEGTGAKDHEPGWVAHVTNVLEQSERYVRDLGDLMHFIQECLTRMGIAPHGAREDTLGPGESGPEGKE